VRNVADEPEPVTGADHLGAECGEPLMRDGAPLEIADVVGRIVHELHVPDAALMRFFEPLELRLEEVEPLSISHDCRLSFSMGRLEISRGKRTSQAMIGDHLADPCQPIEMIFVKRARFRCTQCGEHTG
jgi:hypothetical protein